MNPPKVDVQNFWKANLGKRVTLQLNHLLEVEYDSRAALHVVGWIEELQQEVVIEVWREYTWND